MQNRKKGSLNFWKAFHRTQSLYFRVNSHLRKLSAQLDWQQYDFNKSSNLNKIYLKRV